MILDVVSYVAVTASLVCFLNWLVNYGDAMRLFNKIPGPTKLPILANTLDFLTNQVELFYRYRRWANENKGIFKTYIPPYRVVNIYSPQDIETILSTTKYNEKSVVYSLMKPWLREGLLLSSGAKWHSRRKILTPAFHFNILRHFTDILEENSWRLVDNLKNRMGGHIDLVPIISSYTLHSICESAMGTKLDAHESGAEGDVYKRAIHELGRIIMNRSTRLWMFLDTIFFLTPMGRRHRDVLNIIHEFPKKIIEARRNYITTIKDDNMFIDGENYDSDIYITKNKRRVAMLDLLLIAEKEGRIDADGIQEEVDTFMFEGHDTTACGLVYILMLLANHKESQDKIVEECRRIFRDSDRPANLKDLQEMKYLECCVKEGLRLYPPVPLISRRIGENVQLKDYVVPGGTLCHVHIYDLHRRADLFSEPLQFRPERFLTDTGDSKHPYAYIPFSAGPRNCIGQRFALLEMKSAISAILRTFELQPVTKPEDIHFCIDLVLRSSTPVYVQFKSRNKCD